MKYPKVTIVVPVFNGEEYINNFLQNLRKINYSNFEVIFINDGSTDKTDSLFLESSSINFPTHVHSFPKNKGIRKSIFKGITEAKGKYIFISSVDDRIAPEGIKLLARDLKRYPDKTHLAVSCLLTNKGEPTGQVWDHRFFLEPLDYVAYELNRVSGAVSNSHTLLNRKNLLQAYIEIDKMLEETGFGDIRFAEDLLVTDYMILTGLIKKIIPVYYTFNYFEIGNKKAISKDLNARIKDLPVVLAHSLVQLRRRDDLDISLAFEGRFIRGVKSSFVNKSDQKNFIDNYFVAKRKFEEYFKNE